MTSAAGRYGNLDRSYKLAARSVLTAFSREDVSKAFPSFTSAERERLYKMFIHVIKSFHANIEDEFQRFCQEKEVATVLDKIDQFVEERSLDVLSSDKTSIEDFKEKLSKAKKDEIEHLKGLIEKAEERNNDLKARIEHLKGRVESNTTTDVLEKLKQWNSACQCHDRGTGEKEDHEEDERHGMISGGRKRKKDSKEDQDRAELNHQMQGKKMRGH